MDGQEPTTNNPTPAPQPDPTPTPKTFDEIYVKELRGEAAKYRKELRELQEQFTAIQAEKEERGKAELEQQGQYKELADQARKEAEKLRQKLDEQISALQSERRNNLVISIAGRLGAHDPADPNFITATQAVDMTSEEAQGQIEQIIQGMTTSRPYLFKSQQRIPAQTPFNPAGPTGQLKETDEQRRERLRRRGGQPFDASTAEARGGGVVWPKKSE